METLEAKISAIDWQLVTSNLHQKGYSRVSQIVTAEECATLIANYYESSLYRKTITMERYRFGLGEYKYFRYPLPNLIQTIRRLFYSKLVPVANTWMQELKLNYHFPDTLEELQVLCRENNQTQPTVLILKYGAGGHNTLHQDLYGNLFFPIQVVLFLNQPEEEYTGGEFVLTQQTPRAQSKAIVLRPKKGDMLLFTTNFRPIKGSKGFYRVNMKHGVSEVHTGERHTLGIIFHDALT
ncbi:prolyl 4-hydroxylase subunit alpha [Adhaeribacter arboris]|uniref:Prolyl 4-hydroxylase subunit alpha n=1 Tax=Adhaeribacter arboris TaxID=2072846 RepID=A0A2T2YDS3_9BACT|nr:2OG-Fe(II) oxygenase [Adhaeribacter arboris]PSR53651.1 prolyl 4-hydroxylase subunit alpha [Adhaeribacter arboris]